VASTADMKMAIMQAAVTARLRVKTSAECAGKIADKGDSTAGWFIILRRWSRQCPNLQA
jgi:hypothetical protein